METGYLLKTMGSPSLELLRPVWVIFFFSMRWSMFSTSVEQQVTSAIIPSTALSTFSLCSYCTACQEQCGYMCSYFSTTFLYSQCFMIFLKWLVCLFVFLEKQTSTLKYLHFVTISMGCYSHCKYLQWTNVKTEWQLHHGILGVWLLLSYIKVTMIYFYLFI